MRSLSVAHMLDLHQKSLCASSEYDIKLFLGFMWDVVAAATPPPPPQPASGHTFPWMRSEKPSKGEGGGSERASFDMQSDQ